MFNINLEEEELLMNSEVEIIEQPLTVALEESQPINESTTFMIEQLESNIGKKSNKKDFAFIKNLSSKYLN